ncbi:SLOG family protein [Macrococcus sp. DPC7161]|uniref:SLOG family protein n=1 Tax=Macrococcus sp. DPC7161 TaxID=2507060 RepID=UPI00100B08B7|nr:SLOG family protein [Macrococcus sp. DPC7161]RXK19253.1 DUF1273 family protein [Macrococcus sp. DPC7161]
MKSIYISGYKPYELNIFKQDQKEVKYIIIYLQEKIKQYIEEGLEWVIISGQLGIELWAAEATIRLKKQYDINLAIIEPFLNYNQRWNENNQLYYQKIKSRADFVSVCFKDEYKGPYMFKEATKFILNNTEGTLLIYDEDHVASPQYLKRDIIAFQEKNQYNMDITTLYDLSEFVTEYLRES